MVSPLLHIDVLAPGDRVTIGLARSPADRIEGTITAAKLVGNGIDGVRVSYLVAWWDGRTRNEEWLEPFEIVVPEAAEKIRLGFCPLGHRK